MSLRHFGSSLRMRSASAAGEPASDSKYCASRKSCWTFGSANTARTSALILSTMSGGTTAGPNKPNRSRALVMYGDEVHAGDGLEHFHVQVPARADAIVAVIQLPRPRFAKRYQLFHTVGQHRRIERQCVINADETCDRREIFYRIVGQMRIERRIDDEGRFRADEQGVAVARLPGDIFGGDLIVGSGFVFHDRLRAPVADKTP